MWLWERLSSTCPGHGPPRKGQGHNLSPRLSSVLVQGAQGLAWSTLVLVHRMVAGSTEILGHGLSHPSRTRRGRGLPKGLLSRELENPGGDKLFFNNGSGICIHRVMTLLSFLLAPGVTFCTQVLGGERRRSLHLPRKVSRARSRKLHKESHEDFLWAA